MIKTLIAALLLASCVSKPVFKTDTETERNCLAHYRDGDITWEQYQECLKYERGP